MSNAKLPVQAFFEAFGKGDLAGLLATLHEEVTLKAEGPATVPWYGTYKGIDGAKAFLANLGGNVETQAFTIEQIIAEGETVVANGYLKHRIPATGRLFEGDWALLCKIKEGKIAYYQFFENSAAAEAAFR